MQCVHRVMSELVEAKLTAFKQGDKAVYVVLCFRIISKPKCSHYGRKINTDNILKLNKLYILFFFSRWHPWGRLKEFLIFDDILAEFFLVITEFE